jgi:hypothetical protein
MAVLIVRAEGVRRYLLEFPRDWYSHVPLPLVVALHDQGQTADEVRASWTLHRHNVVADGSALSKAVVIYPESERSGGGGGWNDGYTRSGQDGGADDVDFLDEVLEQALVWLQRAWRRERQVAAGVDVPWTVVDRQRRFLVGFGNGAVMAQRWFTSPSAPAFRGLALVQGTVGGARHGVDASVPARRVSWGPAGPPSYSLGVLFLHNGLDRDWASSEPDSLGVPGGAVSAAESEAVFGLGGQSQAAPDGLARWDESRLASVTAWTSVLGLPDWSGEGGYDAGDPAGNWVKVVEDPARAHGWTDADSVQVLQFFQALG